MKLSSLIQVAALLQCCRAGLFIPSQLSSYFDASAELLAVFNGTYNITQPAQLILTSETQSTPALDIPSSLSNASYIFLMVDADYNATVPTNVVLHTIVGNLTKAPSAEFTYSMLSNTSDAPLASYIGPQPQSTTSHNYTLLLFVQPSNFSVPAAFDSFLPLDLSDIYTRVNFPLVEFVEQTSLGQPIAATYFRLNLTTTTPTSAAATTASAGSMGNSVASWQLIVSGAMFSAVHLLTNRLM